MEDSVAEFPHKDIEIKGIDKLRDTYITIGCYRETHRLDRMLRVFQKAMTLALRDGLDGELGATLAGLHDHKGDLTATWSSDQAARPLLKYVELAWENENECNISHVDANGWFAGIRTLARGSKERLRREDVTLKAQH